MIVMIKADADIITQDAGVTYETLLALLRNIERTPALRADLALHEFAGIGGDKMEASRALLVVFGLLLVFDRLLRHFLLSMGFSAHPEARYRYQR
jgi:hypothetical protein